MALSKIIWFLRLLFCKIHFLFAFDITKATTTVLQPRLRIVLIWWLILIVDASTKTTLIVVVSYSALILSLWIQHIITLSASLIGPKPYWRLKITTEDLLLLEILELIEMELVLVWEVA